MSAFSIKSPSINRLACAALLCTAAATAQAAVVTFDNDEDLNSNFTVDVFAGDIRDPHGIPFQIFYGISIQS